MRVLSLVRIPMSHIHVLVLIWVSNVFSHGPVEFFINKLELLVLIYNINAWGLMVFMFCRMWWWSAVYILPQSKYYIMFLYLPLFIAKHTLKLGSASKLSIKSIWVGLQSSGFADSLCLFQRKNGATSVNKMNGVMFPGNTSIYSERWALPTCQWLMFSYAIYLHL